MSKTKRKILVVDDEANFVDLVQMHLEKRGFEVKTLTKPREVIPVARDYKPDLILLDYIMPKMNGNEVLSNLKRQPELIKTPVVFVSAIATPKAGDGEGIAPDTTAAGSGIVPKPVQINNLVARIEAELDAL
jgi:DNA-binding response OmpR family regulator